LASGYTNLGTGLGNHVILIRILADGSLDSNFGGFITPEDAMWTVGLEPQPGVAIFNPFVADGGFAETYAVAKLSGGDYVTTGYGAATAEGVRSSLGYKITEKQDLVTFRLGINGLDMS